MAASIDQTATEERIVSFWKELFPSSAYLLGFDDYAGQLFIPTDANLMRARRRLRRLKRQTADEVERKVLDSLEADLLFREPSRPIDKITDAIFAHLVKEGVRVDHMHSLLSQASRSLTVLRKRYKSMKLLSTVRMLALYRCNGLDSILDTVEKQTNSAKLRRAVKVAKKGLAQLKRILAVKGFTDGAFEEVMLILEEQGQKMGRRRFYRIALRKGYDYSETPDELEQRALRWLRAEMPLFREVVKRIAKACGCSEDPEAVSKAIQRRRPLRPRQLVRLTKKVRGIVQMLVGQTLVGINPQYRTDVVETPLYLSGTIPTGAAQFFNTFSDPFQYFFVTTEKKRDPVKTFADLLDLLVHEEYGHCVHHSNSAHRYAASPRPIELIDTFHIGPTSEGISFQRELEFLDEVKKLERKKKLTTAERDYVRLMRQMGGLKVVNRELEFEVMKGRITRFLRVIGDVRINSGKQGLLDFIRWAHKETGLPESHIYFQLFPAHEGVFPGYATCYAVVGQQIRDIQRKLKSGLQLMKLNSYASSLGYPPRSVFIRRLKKFVRTL
ncbi:MAG: hypothetical protein ACETVV_01850 [Nitrososphaeria archaeon]